MAATARRRDPDDDIAAIAKQISDQAEAIYQNWKSRGLAPADLISCHAAGDTSKLGSMLKPQPPAKPSIELLAQAPTMDNNRLEKLVKNFVVEDKARIAASRGKAMPSSIQYALQKFEKNSTQNDPSATPANSTTIPASNVPKRSPLRTNNFAPGINSTINSGMGSPINATINATGNAVDATMNATINARTNAATTNSISSTNGPSSISPVVQQLVKPAIGQKPQISPKPRFAETIEMTLPPDTLPTGGLQTWPLKNRVITTENVKKTAAEVRPNTQPQQPQSPHQSPQQFNQQQYNTLPSKSSNSFLDEVALEEKRLIAALKNGDIVSDDNGMNDVNISINRNENKNINRNDNVRNTRISKTNTNSIISNSINTNSVNSHSVNTNSINTNLNNLTINDVNINDIINEVSIGEDITDGTMRAGLAKPKDIIGEINTAKWGGIRNARRPEQQVPHPELTTTQRQHLRQTAANPVRPFLTRGSVAERVLIFERCPSDLLLDKRARAPTIQIPKPQPLPKQVLPHTTLQRHVRANRNVHIPRFYFPSGKPGTPGHLETIKAKVTAAFAGIGERASREHFGQLTKACQISLYWKTPLYLAACADKGSCSLEQFMSFWSGMSSTCHDAASRFVYILTRGRKNYLAPEDFIPMVQDVVETHPGLTFLKEATEFHSRYVHTVIARIFYCVNRSWSGKITVPELRRSNLMNIIQMLEEEEDINQITAYFSYEHFYVIYCKFWELDRDHDLFIDKQDMTRHNDHALSTRIIDRIFSGCVTRGQRKSQHDEKLSYCEFVWFLLSEEDKRHPTAIEYWFRCMDLDGDGYLSMYELEYFYEEQMHRMELIGIETLPFEDCLCQMLDMIKPAVPGKIALSDLKKCKMTPIFFDTFFNLEKYLDHEQRDPFASQRDHDIDGQELSDWDRYAAEEYELLVAEEGGNDEPNSLSFDEENNEEDVLSQNLDVALDITDAPNGLSDDSDDCSI